MLVGYSHKICATIVPLSGYTVRQVVIVACMVPRLMVILAPPVVSISHFSTVNTSWLDFPNYISPAT